MAFGSEQLAAGGGGRPAVGLCLVKFDVKCSGESIHGLNRLTSGFWHCRLDFPVIHIADDRNRAGFLGDKGMHSTIYQHHGNN